MNSDDSSNSLKILATPAGIEPATNSLEVVRKASNFNGHADKIPLSAALSNKTKFQFVGMKLKGLSLKNKLCEPTADPQCSRSSQA